ncbi:MAG: AtzE family amidohydrolase [Alphaproteobacteria bacterium]|nr:AtzE family amidohydrolase [Alphaproteobacteria bacterium]MBM3626853.1 AtzE family amidohydrolase [Alphaproteobacteria bacterium]
MSGPPAAEQSAVARVEAALRRIEAARSLNAATTVLAARALARAAALDRARSDGAAPGPLQGVPFVAKNLFDVAGIVTRAGSAATVGDAPARADAFSVAALERAGAVLVATTNMDELAYGFTGENGPDGDTLNPYDAARISGGSSAGSAALVGAGVVDLALGSDTNGSIRVPSALCGAFGLKATYGRLSRGGAYPFVASLDHVGPIAANPRLLAAAYDALQGADPQDPTQVPRDIGPATPQLDAGISGLRVGILGGYFAGPLDPDAAAALAAAAAVLGAGEAAELRLAEAGRAAAFVITTSEAGHLHRAALSRDPEAFGPLVRDRLAAGALAPAAWYLAAQKLRRRLAEELSALFARFDLLLAPAVPCVAPPRGAETITVQDRTLPMRLAVGMYTHPLTPTGVPVGVAPRAARDGLSVGVQVVAPPWHEVHVLRALAALDAAGFSRSVRMEVTR